MNEPPFVSLPIYTAATTAPKMLEPTNNSHAPLTNPTNNNSHITTNVAVNGGGGPKRNKNPQPPLIVPSGCTCFRLLCHASRIGGVIGKSGSIIKQLQQDTSAKIRVEDPPPGSDDRVITVLASTSVNKTISFDEDDQENSGYVESSEYSEVSAAQEGLVRVFERILSVAAEADGGYFAPGGIVSCRLLSDKGLVGSVIGKGGKVIEKIRKDTGCKLRILGQDKLPSCGLPNDEMVEIEGDILAVKKALVAVARRLQDCPQSDKTRMVGRPHDAVPQETLPNGHMDFHPPFAPPRTPALQHMPTSSTNHSLGGPAPVSLDVDNVPSMDFRNSQQEIVFRILCSSDRVGGIIGKSGTIVRALQNESGASITVGAPVSDCDERLITITAMESPESRNSPAQNAIILVFNRSVEAGFEKGLDSQSLGTPISARLLISPNQIGCLLGKGGSIIADMRKVTGAVIKIVGGHQVPKCASEIDQVVLMTGEFVSVRDALYSVTGRLRNHLFSNRMLNGTGTRGTYGRGNDHPQLGIHHSVANARHFNQHGSLTQSMDNLRLSNHVDHHPPQAIWQSQTGDGNLRSGQDVGRGSTSVKGGLALGSGNRSAIVTNTIVEIIVPEDVISSVYGENGSNLARLRQISGAKVVVHEPRSGTTDHIVVISGTPDETQSAQSLLQAFILADES